MTDPEILPTTKGHGEAYLLFAASLLLVLTIGAAVQLVSLTVGLVVTELVLILLPAVAYVRWKRLPMAAALRWRSVPAGTLMMSVLVGVTGWGVAAGMYRLSFFILGAPPEIPGMTPETIGQLLLMIGCGAVLPGLCEETLFRGVIQGVIRRRGAVKAVVITAILFAAYHLNPWLLVPGFFLGAVFGCLVVRTGSTVPAIVAHMTNNATAFVVGYLLRDESSSAGDIVMLVLAVAFCGAAVLFWKARGGWTTRPPLLARVPARLSRPVAWIAGLLGGAVVAVIIAVVVALFAMVEMHTVTTDALAPEVVTGDQLVMRRAGLTTPEISAGDIIAVRRDGDTVLRRVARVEGETVWVEAGDVEEAVSLGEVEGKMVYRIPATE